MGNIFLAGSLGTIIFGIAFLILICRNKNMSLDGVISIYSLIGYVILTNVSYWRESVLIKKGDGWDFLTYNPQLDPIWLVNCCETLYWAMIFCLTLLLAARIIFQFTYFLKKSFPDLSIFDAKNYDWEKDFKKEKRAERNQDFQELLEALKVGKHEKKVILYIEELQ